MKKICCTLLFCCCLPGVVIPAYTADNYKALFDKGCKEYAGRNYAVAAETLLKALEQAPTPAAKYAVSLRLANIYAAQKNFTAAIEQAEKVLSYEKCGKKEKISYLNLISDAYYRLGKPQEAVTAAEKATEPR